MWLLNRKTHKHDPNAQRRRNRFPSSLRFTLKKSPPRRIAAAAPQQQRQRPGPPPKPEHEPASPGQRPLSQRELTLEARRKGNKAPLSPPLTIQVTGTSRVPETTPTRVSYYGENRPPNNKRPIEQLTTSLEEFRLDDDDCRYATMGGCQSNNAAAARDGNAGRPASIHVRRSGSDNLAPIEVPGDAPVEHAGGHGHGNERDRGRAPAEKKRRSLKEMTQAAVNAVTGAGDTRPPGVRDAERHAKAAASGGGGGGSKKGRKRPRAKLEEYYTVERELGRGHYAVVYRAVDKRSGKRVAVKRIAKKRSSTKKLVNEVKAMQKAGGHPNVVGLYDIFESEDRLDLVMQYVTGGELFDRLIAKGAYSEKLARHHIRRICEALRFLHGLGITHRDLKPENLLLTSKDEDADVVIADFGLSRITDSHRDAMTTVCGTWAYCAPEVKDPSRQKDFGYTHKVDLWSLGVIMYVILCGYHPFDPHGDSKDADIVRKVLRAEYDFDDAAWGNVSREAQDLVSHLLVVDAAKRYDTNDVLRHPWMLRGYSAGLADLPDQPISPKIHTDLKTLQEKMAWK